jgi:hypothetical protein
LHNPILKKILFTGNKGDKIEPLEKGLYSGETCLHKEVVIFLNGKREQYVFKGLTLIGYFQLGVAPPLLELMI